MFLSFPGSQLPALGPAPGLGPGGEHAWHGLQALMAAAHPPCSFPAALEVGGNRQSLHPPMWFTQTTAWGAGGWGGSRGLRVLRTQPPPKS